MDRDGGRSLDPTGSIPSRPSSRSRGAAALTARHHAMRSSRVAFASRSSRSLWHGCGAHQRLLVQHVISETDQRAGRVIIISCALVGRWL